MPSADLSPGDVLVLYIDSVTEADNRIGEEFGVHRLSAVARRGSSQSAEELTIDIFTGASDFCREDGFLYDAAILAVKCDFDVSPTVTS